MPLLIFASIMHLLVTAAGLYYIAELVEEYSSTARKVILFLISFVLFSYTMFIFCDNVPWRMILMGFVTQAFHLAIMSNFPFISFLSFSFLGAICCLLINHVLAFQFFTTVFYPFSEVFQGYMRVYSEYSSSDVFFYCSYISVDPGLLYAVLVAGAFCPVRVAECQ